MLWQVFAAVIDDLREAGRITKAGMFSALTSSNAAEASGIRSCRGGRVPDIGVQQLRFLSAMAGDRANALFFASDLGQRIFQQPFSWKSLGVDIAEVLYPLNINYRTSHQIRSQADRLLGPEVSSRVDGLAETRKGTISVFNGPDQAFALSTILDRKARPWASGLSDA